MARKTFITLIDDVSGEELARDQGETIQFALDGKAYAIDLCPENAQALRDAMAPFAAAGRPVNGAVKRRRKAAANPA